MAATIQAQEKKPDWMRWHYLSEEEMYDTSRGMNFVETDPPTGEPRFVAEFEPMQGVMIRYPLGIPTSLVAQLADNCHVYCIVSSSYQNQAQNDFQSAGVNMDNLTFVNAQSDSYWVRDYGPWYIFEDRQPAIIDNIYNRPRPNDDNMSGVFANFWSIPMYGMNLQHTGGNMMEDGRGHGVSDNLVLQENGNNEANVRQKMRDYLGIDPYHITIDPQGDYIAHVDCWGKYLAPDKILIAQLPSNNSHAADYDSVAAYFARTNCCWGYPYHVYRVQEPGGYTLAPYTNSLILNKTVYVPIGSNGTYNQQALQVYQEAMPGYEIIGVANNTWNGWENTDALHCRTRGVMDFNMLFVDHREVLFGEQAWQDSIPVVSKFIAYSNEPLKTDSLLVYYSIDGGTYQVAHMTATGNPDEYVGYIKGYQGESEINYYVFGADESGHRYTQPVFADLDPHHFTMEAHQPSGNLIVTPDTLWFEHNGDEQTFTIENQTNATVQINAITEEGGYLLLDTPNLPYNLQVGESISVGFLFSFPLKTNRASDDYVSSLIKVQTSIGEKLVTAMISKQGMVNLVYQNEMYFNDPTLVIESSFFNKSVFVPTIRVFSIAEKDTDYLNIETNPTPPFDLEFNGEEAFMFVSLKDFAKGYVQTSIEIETDYGIFEIAVHINEDILSVTELTAETKLYPNPTTGQFTVEGANVAKVEVYNLVGQKVHEAEGKVINIDAAYWHKGIYLVNIIEQNGAVVTKKLVVR
jgi:agmatine/peptidylarginine deiminase